MFSGQRKHYLHRLRGWRPLDTFGDTLHLLLVWHKIVLEWKGFEGGKGSETGPQRQMGPEHTGSAAPRPQAEGLGPCVAVLGSGGECLADKRRIWVFKVLEKRFRLEAGAGQ